MFLLRFLAALSLAAALLTAQANSDAGPRMDDNGLNGVDRGCAMDPNGCPTESLSGDRGLGMDPNG